MLLLLLSAGVVPMQLPSFAGYADPLDFFEASVRHQLRSKRGLISPENVRQAVATGSWRSAEGRHIDFDDMRYYHYFGGERITYDQWKKLPRGVAAKPKTGEEAYVVSLTSWTKRTEEGTPGVWATIESLMRQTKKPDRIILWLSEEEYPGGDKELPQTLLDLQRRGLEIKWTPKNTKALKKLLPALEAGIRANIVSVDDDGVYHGRWLERLCASHKEHLKALHANVGQYMPVVRGQMSCFQGTGRVYYYEKGCYKDHWFPEGCGGVLYCYDDSQRTCYGLDWGILDPHMLTYGLANDDLLFYLCRVLAGTPFYLLGYPKGEYLIETYLAAPLCAENIGQGRNNSELRRILKDFPEFAKKLGVDINQEQCMPPSG